MAKQVAHLQVSDVYFLYHECLDLKQHFFGGRKNGTLERQMQFCHVSSTILLEIGFLSAPMSKMGPNRSLDAACTPDGVFNFTGLFQK